MDKFNSQLADNKSQQEDYVKVQVSKNRKALASNLCAIYSLVEPVSSLLRNDFLN